MPTPYPLPTAAYLHVPFCAHRCGYCDFTVVAGQDQRSDDYLRALERELSSLGQPRPVDTLFVGGGTPTHLPAPWLDRFLRLATHWFPLNAGGEFSVEANPAGLDDDKIACLARHGVNRVSLGVQAFDRQILQTLERDHTGDMVEETVRRLRPHIPNVALDLIFGVPGQTLDLWRETLERAIALHPTHISTYGLTFEKGTRFWARRNRGDLVQTPEELERDMYALALDELPRHGYEHYELSNFARPGFRCRHNETYWAALPYYGFGPGAARYLQGRRETNHRSFTTWVARVLAGQSAVLDVDELAPEDRAREALIVGLRRADGVEQQTFRDLTGFALESVAGPAIARNIAQGLLEWSGPHLRLTRAGKFLADSVIVDCL
ncbi:MAG: radical SAM family heme chaperone HemW [Planctomycetes bacterium]|nr:radical SAM family heme chaperone HemW [Planctomycetota bacterium]